MDEQLRGMLLDLLWGWVIATIVVGPKTNGLLRHSSIKLARIRTHLARDDLVQRFGECTQALPGFSAGTREAATSEAHKSRACPAHMRPGKALVE